MFAVGEFVKIHKRIRDFIRNDQPAFSASYLRSIFERCANIPRHIIPYAVQDLGQIREVQPNGRYLVVFEGYYLNSVPESFLESAVAEKKIITNEEFVMGIM